MNQFINITKGKTRWFFIVVVFLTGVGFTSLIYISLLSTSLYIEGLNEYIYKKQPLVALSLITPKVENYKIGDLVEVGILLENGQKKTTGVDIVLTYDPQIVELQGKNSQIKQNGKTEPKNFLDVEFSSFDFFPYFNLNTKNGKIYFSALARPLREVVGKGVIATLTFKVIKTGETSINLVFEKGLSSDSNVAYAGRDILKQVRNLNLVIK
ncbi:MAG: hypothetical protein HYV52_01245 [Parcubacteria group bacterium]|nr:hypothetical protein [Parcubacteria group bacterium]